MSDDRHDPVVRRGALLLSYLVLTPDSGLDAFVRRKVVCEGIDATHLSKMRTILDGLGFAIKSKNREDWRKVEQAWEILKGVERPADEGGSPAGVAPSERPAATPTPAPPPEPQGKPTQTESHDSKPPSDEPSDQEGDSDEQGATTSASTDEPHDIGETAFLDASALFSDATPFQADAAAVPLPSAHFAGPSEDIGATAAVDPREVAAALADMPTAAASALPLEINDYASLVAHTELGGPAASEDAREQRHAQRGIEDEAQRTAIDITFSDYFRDNPTVFEQYLAALETWRAWLRGNDAG